MAFAFVRMMGPLPFFSLMMMRVVSFSRSVPRMQFPGVLPLMTFTPVENRQGAERKNQKENSGLHHAAAPVAVFGRLRNRKKAAVISRLQPFAARAKNRR